MRARFVRNTHLQFNKFSTPTFYVLTVGGVEITKRVTGRKTSGFREVHLNPLGAFVSRPTPLTLGILGAFPPS